MFYGAPGNLLLPGFAGSMGEGWETARRRGPGNDWVQVRLAAPGVIRLAELDATHFKGNAPGAARLSGLGADQSWHEILPRTRLQPDTRHRFRLVPGPAVDQVRLDVYPDGGLARLRLYGELTEAGRARLLLRWFNLLPPGQALAVLAADTALPPAETTRLVEARPLSDPDALTALG